MFARDEELSTEAASFEASLKRAFKEKFYNKLPFWMGPMGYFFFRYFFQLGFLDGRPGLIYHFLQGGWYRFLVGAKIVEYDRELVACPDNAARLEKLEALTGHRLR